MRLPIKITLLGTLLLTAATAFAFVVPKNPPKCPTVESINAFGIHEFTPFSFGFTYGATSNYGTPHIWKFEAVETMSVIGDPQKRESYANGLLRYLNNVGDYPMYYDDLHKKWICEYYIWNPGNRAVASTNIN